MSFSITTNIAYSKDNVSEAFAVTQTASASVTGYQVLTPTLGTAATQLSTATITTLGYAFMRSLVTTTQTTCTISIGTMSGTTLTPMVKLRAGEPALLRLAPGTYGAQAAAEGYRLLFNVFEE